ncbi:MAG: cytochrome c [Candidatus Acidiferrales bacterium]
MDTNSQSQTPVPAKPLGASRRALVGRAPVLRVAFSVLALVLCMALADGSWLKKVPRDYHTKVNPYAGQPAAIAGGARLFADHCAKCHGADALGDDKHPSLRSDRIQIEATPGDIFWLLKNGNLRRGMPTWSAIPEPSRWQIIAYVKSLGPVSAAAPAANTP